MRPKASSSGLVIAQESLREILLEQLWHAWSCLMLNPESRSGVVTLSVASSQKRQVAPVIVSRLSEFRILYRRASARARTPSSTGAVLSPPPFTHQLVGASGTQRTYVVSAVSTTSCRTEIPTLCDRRPDVVRIIHFICYVLPCSSMRGRIRNDLSLWLM